MGAVVAVGLTANQAGAVDRARGAVAGVTDETADRRERRRAGLEPEGALDAVSGEPGSGDLTRVVDAAREIEATAECRQGCRRRCRGHERREAVYIAAHADDNAVVIDAEPLTDGPGERCD